MTRKDVLVCGRSNEIKSLVTAWAIAWNRHDMEAASALVAPDVDFVNVLGLWLKGRQEFVDYHRQLHATQMRDSTWTNLHHEVRFMRDDLAIVHLEWAIEGDYDSDGTLRYPRGGLFTRVLSYEDTVWRIVAAQNTNRHPSVARRSSTTTSPTPGASGNARARYHRRRPD
jgi:uncharacterized protein (TIGR02246 family)